MLAVFEVANIAQTQFSASLENDNSIILNGKFVAHQLPYESNFEYQLKSKEK